MKVYGIRFKHRNGVSCVSSLVETSKQDTINFAKEIVKEWNDGTTFTILTFTLTNEEEI